MFETSMVEMKGNTVSYSVFRELYRVSVAEMINDVDRVGTSSDSADWYS